MDDYASMLLDIEARLPRDEIAASLGVDEDQLDEIASGYVPNEEVAARLRALAAGGQRRVPFRRASIGVRTLILFVVIDALVFALVAALALLR